MRIHFKNIGVFQDAAIDVDGFTVISGYNNSGKSTILKSLYCVTEALSNVNEKRRIEEDNLLNKLSFVVRDHLILEEMSDDYSADAVFIKSKAASVKDIRGDIRGYIDKISNKKLKASLLNQYEQNMKYLNSDIRLFINKLIENNIQSEFGTVSQLRTAFCDRESKIELSGDRVGELMIENESVRWSGDSTLFKDVFFYDTPFIVDSVKNSMTAYTYADDNATADHRSKIKRCIEPRNDVNLFEKMENEDKINLIFDKINEIVPGKVQFVDKSLYYVDGKGNKFDVKNIAAGMKEFIIIKQLIENGYLKDDSLLILDEPEVHLHPEWQDILAEMLIVLSKELGIKVVISTHSSQLLMSLELYSKKHSVNVDYYDINVNGDHSDIEHVNDNLDNIYRKFADAMSETCDQLRELQ